MRNCDPVAVAEVPPGPTILVGSLPEDLDTAALELNLDAWSEVVPFGTAPAGFAKEPADSLF